MSMVEVRHRASGALQKPALHETAGSESRLWIFDLVSSGAAERKAETSAPSLSGGRGQIGRFASCAPQVRGLARKTKDGPQARRLLALAAIYDGATRTEAAKIGGVGLQIIRDWVLRFNARG